MKTAVLIVFSSVLYILLNGVTTSGTPGWHALGKSSYRFVNALRTFHDAREYCQKFGGDLAHLKTGDIDEFVQRLIGNHSVWFGLTFLGDNCSYQWIDGSSLDYNIIVQRFTEGNGSSTCNRSIHCVQLGAGGWHEHNCSLQSPFVCENSDIHRVTERPVDVYQWVSNPYAPVSLLKILVITRREQEMIFCKHITYDRRDALTQHISSNILTISQSSAVHDLLLDPNSKLHTSGEVVCEIPSAFDEYTTTISAFHLVPGREAEPEHGRFTQTAYPGTRATLVMHVFRLLQGLRLLIPAWTFFKSDTGRGDVVFPSVYTTIHVLPSTSETDQGTYVTIINNDSNNCRRSEFNGSAIRLIVPDCPSGRWGPPTCQGICNPCYNGGICHDLSGSCICPPGFIGNNCLTACGEHRFGSDCEITCGVDQKLNMSCAGSQICRPDPYGCNCMSGYTGTYCNSTCGEGRYGVDCLQTCHCSGETACDIYSGKCPEGCEEGWAGPSCQVPETCPDGFYGEHCEKVCHCLNSSCDPQTGYCVNSDGACAIGYETGPLRETYCDIYVGCFDSCSKTCRCSEGAQDCNSVTGSCSSGKCLSGWDGQACQTGRNTTNGTTVKVAFNLDDANGWAAAWSGGSALWALFGITLACLVVCLGVLLALRLKGRMMSKLPKSGEGAPSDPTYMPLTKNPNTVGTSITVSSSVNVYVDEKQSSPADIGTPEDAYQPLYKDPKASRKDTSENADPYDYEIPTDLSASSNTKIQNSGDLNLYEEPINPSAVVYQNSNVKIIKKSK